jgi:hypothetical protein
MTETEKEIMNFIRERGGNTTRNTLDDEFIGWEKPFSTWAALANVLQGLNDRGLIDWRGGQDVKMVATDTDDDLLSSLRESVQEIKKELEKVGETVGQLAQKYSAKADPAPEPVLWVDFFDNLADDSWSAGEQTTEEIIQELEADGFPAREVLGRLRADVEKKLTELKQQSEEE